MTTISKTFIEEFIEVFKYEPALWLRKIMKNTSKKQKNKSWNNLLRKYKQVDEDATVETVKKKINSLRAGYRRELRKIRESEKCEASDADMYIPSLWYFNSLDFLRDQEEQMEEITKFDDYTEQEENESVTPPPTIKRKYTDCSLQTPPTSKKVKYNEIDYLQKAVDHLDYSKKQSARDEADNFGEGWAIIYRKLQDDQKIYAKRIIDEALMEARMGHLSYYSSINLEVP